MSAESAAKSRGISNPVFIGLLLIFVIVIDVFAFLLFPPFDPEAAAGRRLPVPRLLHQREPRVPGAHTAVLPVGHELPAGLIVFDVSISSTQLTMFFISIIVLVAPVAPEPQARAEPGQGPERDRVRVRDARELRHVARRPEVEAVHPAVRRLLPVHPVLQLERPDPADRQDRGPPRPHQRPQRHDRPRAGRVRVHRVPGLQAPGHRLPGQVLPVRGVPEGPRRRAHRRCSWA